MRFLLPVAIALFPATFAFAAAAPVTMAPATDGGIDLRDGKGVVAHVPLKTAALRRGQAKLRELVKQARQYSFDFYEWKKQFVLRKHWLAHTKRTCPRCDIPFHKGHLGVSDRRSFWCERCQRRYD